jgi:hypothetical protein
MSNYFSEQLRIRKEIARERWERARAVAPHLDEGEDDIGEWVASLSFAEFWEFEFDRWINNAATDCMRWLGTYSLPILCVN